MDMTVNYFVHNKIKKIFCVYLYLLSQLLYSHEQFKLTVLQTDKSYNAPVWQCSECKVHI